MRDFPSCFGESGVQIADASSSSSSSSSKTAQNLVTCLYQAQLNSYYYLFTITWSKNLMGQGLNIAIDDSTNQCIGKLDIKPWLFSKKKGSKCLDSDYYTKIEVFWDLSSAKFGSGPEPLENFYIAVLFDQDMVLLLGDLDKEAFRKTGVNRAPSNTIFISKREHLFSKKVYSTNAQFCNNGRVHNIVIECDVNGLKEPNLEIRIDRKRVLLVKRLMWKFRGNQTILVDGIPVEVFWDVHNWLFDAPVSNAVFMFQTCFSSDKLLPWSCSGVYGETQLRGVGFSLILYAWKNE